MISWNASNNSTFLSGARSARTMRAAVRDAHRYVDGELYGDGNISYYKDMDDCRPVRMDAKTMVTGYKWVTLFGC